MASQSLRQQLSAAMSSTPIPIYAGEDTADAVLLNQNEYAILQRKVLEPYLRIHRRTWPNKIIVTSTYLLYPSSCYQLFGRFTNNTQ